MNFVFNKKYIFHLFLYFTCISLCFYLNIFLLHAHMHESIPSIHSVYSVSLTSSCLLVFLVSLRKRLHNFKSFLIVLLYMCHSDNNGLMFHSMKLLHCVNVKDEDKKTRGTSGQSLKRGFSCLLVASRVKTKRKKKSSS